MAPSVELFSSAGLFGRRRNVFLKPESNFFLPFEVGDNSALDGVSPPTSLLWSSVEFGLLVSSTSSGSLISGVHKSGDDGITFGDEGVTT